MTYPGGDTIGIVEMQPTGAGVDYMNQEIEAPVLLYTVYGAVFEPIERGPVEEQSDTITSHERAWAFLPYVLGKGIPTTSVDDNGNTVFASMPTNANYVQPQRPDAQDQRNYKIFGLPELQYDIDGLPDHVWITCEWRAG